MAASPRAAVMLACATLVALASGFKTTGPALLATRAPRSAAWRCASAVSQAQSAPARIGALPPPRSSSEVPKYALNDGAGVMTNILGGLSLDQSGASPRGLGLRPARYLRTSDGLICMMSETSGVPVPHDTIVEKVIKPKGIMGLPPSPHMLTRHLIGGPRSRRTLSTARYTIAYYIELLTRTIEPLLGEGDFRGVLEFLKNAESDHEQVQQNHEQVQQSLKYTTLLEKNLRTTEFEFACFKSRTESTLLTRQHVETLLGLMRISNGSPTAQANLFGASLVTQNKKSLELNDGWAKAFCVKIGVPEGPVAEHLSKNIYYQWCDQHHVPKKMLRGLPGITVDDANAVVGAARFIFLASAQLHTAVAATLGSTEIRLLVLTKNKKRTYAVFYPKRIYPDSDEESVEIVYDIDSD